MKETRLINRFSEKKSHLGKWTILGTKIAHPHNWIYWKNFFNILHNERGYQVDESDINNLAKKVLFGANGPFWGQKCCILIIVDPL